MTHPLDRAVWTALTTRRADLAVGTGRARRIDPSIGLFVAIEDRSAASFDDLAELVTPGETVGMIETDAWPLPDAFHATGAYQLAQMIATEAAAGPTLPDILSLTDADAPDMLALATLTRPGPFFAGTHRLGGYVGVRRNGVLVAMAGTRLSLPGFVEVSAICTHPDYRGRGFGAALTRHLVAGIHRRGEVPFLTSYVTNTGAIALYESLGFRTRREMTFATIERR
ncbi:GNAT family N-acetyltransferase [Sphingomonas sp. R86521]|uniref:GNAT family N-acetyltransferase n=1 Tax=Sphingomonas sp. R86521 TaxID=3093860 RepID=UPI0036D3C231